MALRWSTFLASSFRLYDSFDQTLRNKLVTTKGRVIRYLSRDKRHN